MAKNSKLKEEKTTMRSMPNTLLQTRHATTGSTNNEIQWAANVEKTSHTRNKISLT